MSKINMSAIINDYFDECTKRSSEMAKTLAYQVRHIAYPKFDREKERKAIAESLKDIKHG